MRNQLKKIKSKEERRVSEIFKKNHIKFEAQARIGKYCVDFLIGRVVIEVDGLCHEQTNRAKDTYLFSQGFVPLHITTSNLKINEIEKEIIYLVKKNNKVGLVKS